MQTCSSHRPIRIIATIATDVYACFHSKQMPRNTLHRVADASNVCQSRPMPCDATTIPPYYQCERRPLNLITFCMAYPLYIPSNPHALHTFISAICHAPWKYIRRIKPRSLAMVCSSFVDESLLPFATQLDSTRSLALSVFLYLSLPHSLVRLFKKRVFSVAVHSAAADSLSVLVALAIFNTHRIQSELSRQQGTYTFTLSLSRNSFHQLFCFRYIASRIPLFPFNHRTNLIQCKHSFLIHIVFGF